MSVARVHAIASHRGRRAQRLELTRALHAGDPVRASLLERLLEATERFAANRAAILRLGFFDGIFRPHFVLDLGADRPRARFRDTPSVVEDGILHLIRKDLLTTWVFLGSDVVNLWFLVVEGSTGRREPAPEDEAALAFIAGQCSAVVLHDDMKQAVPKIFVPEGGPERFEGWLVLKDIDGHEKDEELNARIAMRFSVVRALLSLLHDGLECDPAELDHRIGCYLKEIDDAGFEGDRERESWEEVLAAVRRRDGVAAARATVTLASKIAAMDHFSGAREFYRCAYLLAAMSAAAPAALASALGAAQLAERRRRLKDAGSWYHITNRVAEALSDAEAKAISADGLSRV